MTLLRREADIPYVELWEADAARSAEHCEDDREPRTSLGFLTNNAMVLICIADDPGIRLRDIGDRIGITERAGHRIAAEPACRLHHRQRNGRRNPLHDQTPTSRSSARLRTELGELLEVLTGTRTPNGRVDRTPTTR